MTSPPTQVAILRAGPVGLDAALACADAGLPFTVYEAGSTVGAHLAAWSHVRLFTPWRINLSPRMRTHLPDAPDTERCPSGAEFHDTVLRPLAAAPALAGRIQLAHRVRAVGRTGLLKHQEISTATRAAAPFRLLHRNLRPAQPDGRRRHRGAGRDGVGQADHLHPSRARGSPGARPVARHRRARRAGKSTQTAAQGLAALPGTRLQWVIRDPAPGLGGCLWYRRDTLFPHAVLPH